MIAAAPSPTQVKSRTRPDYAREIWENGFREEAERIAIALNKDKRKQVDTTREFWDSAYTDYLFKLSRKLSKKERFDQMGQYDSENVRNGVWKLLFKHFDKPIKVKAPVAPMTERSGTTGKAAGSSNSGNGSKKKLLQWEFDSDCKNVFPSYDVSFWKKGKEFRTIFKVHQKPPHKGFEQTFDFDLRKISWSELKERYYRSNYANYCWLWRTKEAITYTPDKKKRNALAPEPLQTTQAPSAPATSEKKRVPVAQTLFGNPAELASLVAFCDAQIELWPAGSAESGVRPYFEEIKKRLLSSHATETKMMNFCPECSTSIVGRSHKQFCSTRCRVAHHRKNQAA